MKLQPTLLTLAVIAAFSVASCARKEPPVVVELQPQATQAPVGAAQQPPPEPIRESSWKPAPARTAVPQNTQRPAMTPVQNTPEPVQQTPPPAPAPAPVVVENRPAPVQQAAPARVTQQPMQVTIAEGSVLAVRLNESLSSEKNETGDSWSGALAEPLVVNGLVIAERGSRVEGRVTNAKRAGRVKGVANLTVQLTRFQTADGQSVAVQSSAFSRAGKDETKKDVGKVAIASGIGAAIGAIAGGGKGAGIGAGAGAAAGTGTVLVMRGGPAVLSAETLIRFRVTEPVTITEKLK